MISAGLLARIFTKKESKEPQEVLDSETRDILLRAKAEADNIMFYKAAYDSTSGHDPYLLRFLGRDGIKNALTTSPPSSVLH